MTWRRFIVLFRGLSLDSASVLTAHGIERQGPAPVAMDDPADIDAYIASKVR